MSHSVASSTAGPSTFLGDETIYSQNFDATYSKSDYLRNAYYYLSHRKSLLSLWQNLSYQDSAFDETVPTDSIPSMDLVSLNGESNVRELSYAQWDLTGESLIIFTYLLLIVIYFNDSCIPLIYFY